MDLLIFEQKHKTIKNKSGINIALEGREEAHGRCHLGASVPQLWGKGECGTRGQMESKLAQEGREEARGRHHLGASVPAALGIQ